MNEICVNEQRIEKIEFIDKSDHNKVLGTLTNAGIQECNNGYAFKVVYQVDAVKE